MELLSLISLLLGSSWAAGVNLYLTTAGLGIAHRMQLITLPGDMEILSNVLVIGVAVTLYAIEFFADKIPYVDSAWDLIHTFIRPAGGLAMGYLAMSGAEPQIQYAVALLTGAISLESHLTKATARAAINTSPEPITNLVASVIEDISVAGILFLVINHPIIASIVVILLIVISVWFLKKMFKFLKRVFSSQKKPQAVSTS